MIDGPKHPDCVSLRTAAPEDLPAVLSLLERSELPTAGVADSFSHFLVAEAQEKLVGVAGLELYDGSALLRSVAVDGRWRGTGVGRLLVERAIDLARDRGIEDVYLLTTTAEHYFPKFGFTCVSRDAVAEGIRNSVEFQCACPASAKVMRRAVERAHRSEGQGSPTRI